MTSTTRSGSKSKKSQSGLDGALLALLQASSLACITTDSSRRVTTCNAGAEVLLGRKAVDVVDQPLSQVLPDAAAEITGNTTDLGHADVSIEKKNGETVKVEIWSSSLPAQAGHLLLLHNITEKKFLENALLEAADREQRRIGQDLHDHLCQHLLGAAFSAKALAGALDREESRHATQLHDLARLINDAVSQVRDISRGLHPVELDAAGLMSALQELANRAKAMVPCVFRCEGHVLVKNTNAALNAYRIAQEAVTAALQQTGATKIQISLSQTGDSIRLEISDDGKKQSELTADPAGIAPQTLQYRSRAMHGLLSMDFRSDRGTQITCLFPS